MKKIYNLIAFGLLTLSLGCDDFLDKSPTFQENSANFYVTETDFVIALMGAYDGLQQVYNTNNAGGLWVFTDLRTDIAEVRSTAGANWDAYSDFILFSNNLHLETHWNRSFNVIYRSNVILERVLTAELSDVQKSNIEAEARFIRGLVYFDLVRLFGEVPLVSRPVSITESYDILRESTDNVYAQIIEDLEFASLFLPDARTGNQQGLAIKSAAVGLLAKVYLTRGDYQKSSELCKQIIDSGNFRLLDSYEEVFSLSFPNQENIFEIQYASNSNNEGSRFFQVFMPQGTLNGQGQGYCVPTQHFADSFEQGDLRKDFIIISDLPGSMFPGTMGSYKYRDPSAGVADGGNNWIVLRYADVLLMYAEAINKIEFGNPAAFNALNEVRNRAGLSSLSTQELPNQTSFDLAVENERKIELSFEGHRWFDLVRRNRFLEVMNNEYNHPSNVIVTEAYNLYPIPLSVINTNSRITQNPGYDF
ncbi:RagB/SusD family nutrient uptake outer membrane protein [Algoriphagus hitonicola]|uniref:RagB/SusD domain-containing protein n=1 Tax=Algoriphagus hitonicola TaxID=435880 RepID=A0A1I2SZ15_9BACT|nr:RagB/SusD family nutrient uptake outer membrane protein [Algoriphagus hitonicola]SFG57169.1 RagB/SusD domain-containing protein [Algoriphagus hitonicola]